MCMQFAMFLMQCAYSMTYVLLSMYIKRIFWLSYVFFLTFPRDYLFKMTEFCPLFIYAENLDGRQF